MDVYTRTLTRMLHSETVKVSPSGTVFKPDERDAELIIGFTKPKKPIINKKVDGFRKPSSYAVRSYDYSSFSRSGRVTIPIELSGSGTSFRENRGWQWDISGTYCTPCHTAAPAHANVNEVRMSILNNIKDEVFDAAMVLAEMQSTVDTVSSNLNRVGRSLMAIRRDKPRHFYYLLTGKTRDGRRPTQKFLKESSGVYLEWKYGITPTLLDLQGACKALDMNEDGSLWNHPPLLVARSSRRRETVENVPFTAVEAAGDSKTVTAPVKYFSEYKARCDYRIKSEGLRGLNRYGLGLGTVATVLWDKQPFTFVLDMVIPIADIVKAWSALSGTEVVGYCETLYQSAEVMPYSGNVVLRDIPCTYQTIPYKTFGFERTAFDKPPMPVPYARNPIKVGNFATVLALFTQLRKSA